MIQITEKEFAMLTEYIHSEYGIELKKEKQPITFQTIELQTSLLERGSA